MSDSIKVAIKLRPPIKRERDEDLPVQWKVKENTILPVDPELRKRGDDGGFVFDHIWDMDSTNVEVFDTVVKPIVEATVKGFNGTVFAYGQTSSGKTYTMMGTPEHPGVIPLAIEYIFDSISNTAGRKFLLRVSYFEIYNEKVNDLLNVENVDLKVHEDSTGIFIKCKEEVVRDPKNVLSLMKRGERNRRTGETNMNERSSRSHTIFRINIESLEDESDGAVQISQLNLVDLAGSERVRQTGATGERFKEGKHINMSLSALALVIMQLSEAQDPQKFINFRDSKLTRILQASLGGNAMTAIICAVTPFALEETQCTLAFASRAKSVKNKPHLNEVTSDATLLKRYAKQLAKLTADLEEARQVNRLAEVEEMQSKLQEKERTNQLLEERIEMLKTRIVSGGNESFKVKSSRRRTWGGPSTFSHRASLPTIEELNIKEPAADSTDRRTRAKRRQSIMQQSSISDLMNEKFETALEDFELELLQNEKESCRYSVDSIDGEEEVYVTRRKRENRVKFLDDVSVYAISEDEDEEISDTARSCSPLKSDPPSSPGTPKHVLREKLAYLTHEFNELQEFTTLEKQLVEESAVEKRQANNEGEEVLNYLRKSVADSEMMYREINKKYSELQTEHLQFVLKHDVTVKELEDLKRQVDSLSTAEERLVSVEHEKKELQTAMNTALKKQKSLEAEKNDYAYEMDLMKEKHKRREDELLKSLELAWKDYVDPKDKEKLAQLIHLQSLVERLTKELESLRTNSEAEAPSERLPSTDDRSAKSKLEEHAELAKEREEMSEKISRLESRISDLECEKTEMTGKFADLRTELNEKILEIESRDARDYEGQIYTLNSYVANLQGFIKTLEDENDALKRKAEEKNVQEVVEQASEEHRESIGGAPVETSAKTEEPPARTSPGAAVVTTSTTSSGHSTDDKDSSSIFANVTLLSDTSLCENDSVFDRDTSSAANDDSLLEDVLKSNDTLTLKKKIGELNKSVKHLEAVNKELATEVANRTDRELGEKIPKLMNDVVLLEETNAKLAADLRLKVEETDGIKKDVQGLRMDTEKLQQTIYLLTSENMDMSSKLSEQRDRAKEAESNLQSLVDELYARVSKLTEEKSNLEEELTICREQIESLQEKTSVAPSDEISEYNRKIDELMAENIELSSFLEKRLEELEKVKESKALLYEHECVYKEEVEKLSLISRAFETENSELSNKLIEKIEEYDNLKETCELLKSKLENELRNALESSEHNADALRSENNRLRAETVELRAKVSTLFEENAKFSECLLETMEELDNTRRMDSPRNKSLHNSIRCNDDASLRGEDGDDESTEALTAKIKSLQEKVEHLTCLNKKLSESKVTSCTQCAHLKDVIGNHRALKVEIKRLNHKLQDLQQKFERKCADTEALRNKANEEVDLSACDSSLNGSLMDGASVSFVEEKVQFLTNELDILKEGHVKLSNLYKVKCSELEKLHEDSFSEISSTPSKSIASSSRKDRFERIRGDVEKLNGEFHYLKKRYSSVSASLQKFANEKTSMQREIDSLRSVDEEFKKSLVGAATSAKTLAAKIDALESETKDLRNEVRGNEQLVKEYEQSLSEWKEKALLLTQELAVLKEEREQLIEQRSDARDAEKSNASLKECRDCIVKEIISLKPKTQRSDYDDESVTELFHVFLRTIMSKEQEIIKKLTSHFERDKQRLEDEKRQSVNSEKRVAAWAKELEADVQKFQNDLSEQERATTSLRAEIARLENLLKERDHENNSLKEKIAVLETDFGILQADFEKQSKADVKRNDMANAAQGKERLALESMKNREAELEIKMKSEKELYNNKLEELTSSLERYRTKNLELQNNVEGFEANEKHLKSTLDIKSSDLAKSTQKIQVLEARVEKLEESRDQLSRDKSEQARRIEEITVLLKSKCDSVSELQTKLEMITPEYELLRCQLSERKSCSDKYKSELDNLKLESEKQIDVLKDQLGIEEMKCLGLSEQITELSNRNAALSTESDALKERCEELTRENEKLTRKVRNSTSKVKTEAQVEELQDQITALQKNVEGASNRIKELQDLRSEAMKTVIELRGKYELVSREKEELQRTVDAYRDKLKHADVERLQEKYDALLREKNQIALEFEEKKLLLSQREQDLARCRDKSEELQVANQNLEDELDELVKVINTLQNENAELIGRQFESTKKVSHERLSAPSNVADNERLSEERRDELRNLNAANDALRRENDKLVAKVSELEAKLESRSGDSSRSTSPLLEMSRRRRRRSDLFNQNRQLDDCRCEILTQKVRDLELELVSKNGKIATLEIQIQSENFPYQKKCKDLEENLLAFKKKNTELKADVKRLHRTMMERNTRECEDCKKWRTNRRDQATQSIPEYKTFLSGASSGIVDEYVKVHRLEKEKALMKELCRSRSREIKKLQQKVEELESTLEGYASSDRGYRGNKSCLRHDKDRYRKAMKENVPADTSDNAPGMFSSRGGNMWNSSH